MWRDVNRLKWIVAATLRLKRLASSSAPWGEDLSELSFSSLNYCCSWSDVAADELVYLLPSLCADPKVSANDGVAQFLRRDLERCISVVDTLSESVLPRHPVQELIALVLAPDAEPLNELPPGDVLFLRCPPSLIELSFTLTTISHLARLLRDIELAAVVNAEDALPPRTLCEALTSSVYTGINSAYVYPAYRSCHEVLATGAWLGQLLRGRSAYLPVFIAECLVDYLNRPSSTAPDTDACAAALVAYSQIVKHNNSLAAIARRVCASRRIEKVTPHIFTSTVLPDRVFRWAAGKPVTNSGAAA